VQRDGGDAARVVAELDQAGAFRGVDLDRLLPLLVAQVQRVSALRHDALHPDLMRRAVLAVPHAPHHAGPLRVALLEGDHHLVARFGEEEHPAPVPRVRRGHAHPEGARGLVLHRYRTRRRPSPCGSRLSTTSAVTKPGASGRGGRVSLVKAAHGLAAKSLE
jgi:hypothetical protein